MNDFILFLFIVVVFYYIINSLDAEYYQCGISYFRNNKNIIDNQLNSFDKWQSDKNATVIPKIPHILLEGFNEKINIDSTKPILQILNSEYEESLDDYGNEPITDRLNTNVVGARSNKYSDMDLLTLNLLRTKYIPEEENAYRQELKKIEESQYNVEGNDLNNKISQKLKKNNQIAKKNNNAKVSFAAVRDDLGLDFVDEQQYMPWWEESIDDKFGSGFDMNSIIENWR